ncbi:helix-turn-helix transcriptional regulator [Aliarcobacter cibarius]|uniref:AlpA family phage regulatory protein n=1 Tax=Aliarcobacter cibarius TaxID=255507 RepID=A0ABY2V6K3_9BACT|nr:AlpA family phage regulatory protein [Aliarcobacter cibarius]TLS99584.1 AlpA family phage regulatory protein [Aliarcobacter cibarius]TLT00021.1 AlpA family phage regulatory protein [Aliarcobacter cibarius]
MSNFLRIKDVMKKTGIAKSTIWLWVSEGKFPKPIKLSPRITVWDEELINRWQDDYK